MQTRPELLEGSTYKLKFDHLNNALYATINNQEVDGKLLPCELFLNSLDPSTLKWAPLLARLVSAMFRANNEPEYIVKELNDLFEAEPFFYKGKQYYSISQVIGGIIHQHCKMLNEENKHRATKTNNESMS